MKQHLAKIVLGVTLLAQPILAGEVESNQSQPKPLRVEKGAVKVGDGQSAIDQENQPKTRGLLVKNPSNTPNKTINMNIGKVEFYVK